jgi:transposase InsO family protein
VVKPAQKIKAVKIMQAKGISVRKACLVMDVSRTMLYYESKQSKKDQYLAQKIKSLSDTYPRFGYRRIAVMLSFQEKKSINAKRVYRLWQNLNLQLPKKRPKRKRVSSSANKLKSLHTNHVWSYDFVSDKTATGRKLKILTVVDEHTRECLALEVATSIRSHHLIETLSRLMSIYGKPGFIRSDNGPEFTSKSIIKWLSAQQVGPSYINPGSPWENGYIESFNGKFRDECLSREWFVSLQEAQIIIEKWRRFYNTKRPHSSLGYQTPSAYSGRKNVA